MKIRSVDFKTGFVLAVVLTLWLRTVMFMIGFNFTQRINPIPITTREMDFSENIPIDSNDPWFNLIQPTHRFDALWYEEISKTNYQGNPQLTAFFPLYPAIVSQLGILLNITYPAAAFILNTVLTALVFFLLYYLSIWEYGKKIAIRTVFIYAIFPTSFFLLSPYAEPLLIVFILTSFILAKHKRIFASVIAGSLAAMTKPYGMAIFVPLAIIFLKDKQLKIKLINIFLLALIPIASFLTIKYQNYASGLHTDPLAAQSAWGVKIPFPWQPILQQVNMFIRNPFDLANNLYLIVLLGGLYLLVNSYKKIRTEYWYMSFVFFGIFYFFTNRIGVVPSISRHALILFPLFMFLGRIKVGKITEFLYCATSVFLLILSFIYFTFGFFIA